MPFSKNKEQKQSYHIKLACKPYLPLFYDYDYKNQTQNLVHKSDSYISIPLHLKNHTTYWKHSHFFNVVFKFPSGNG